jgi:hypothetical protein
MLVRPLSLPSSDGLLTQAPRRTQSHLPSHPTSIKERTLDEESLPWRRPLCPPGYVKAEIDPDNLLKLHVTVFEREVL